MRMNKDYSGVYACDFETIVNENTQEQTETGVWSACYVELVEGAPVVIESSIERMFNRLTLKWNYGDSVLLYFHNLKFDGSFILSMLLNQGRKYIKTNLTGKNGHEYLDKSKMRTDEFNCVISSLGSFYSMTFKWNGVIIEIRDSLKLIPGSLKSLGKEFGTKHQKTDMEYKGCKTIHNISLKEREYIENDVLVLKECLLTMFEAGHKSLTIGGCCMSEFHKTIDKKTYDTLFPDLTLYSIEELGITQYEYVRNSYRGGWCYVNRLIAGVLLFNGETDDANSHYPSVMDSDYIYPVGVGEYYKATGNEFTNEAKKKMLSKSHYYFIRFKCHFKLKKNKYPFIQIKNNPYYNGREMLETSSVTFKGKKYKTVKIGHETFESRPEITLTKEDWKLFQETYEITDLEIFDCLIFKGEKGKNLFHTYIDKYRVMKIEAGKEEKKAVKKIAKLFLNNLYGKFATDPRSDYKIPELDKNGVIKYKTIIASDKKAGYIPIGSAITSYARCVTIRLADANYNHFAYADTDSVHLYNLPEGFTIKGVKLDPLEFGCWATESKWDKGKFLRAKTYAEHITHVDNIPVVKIKDKETGEHKKPYWDVKAAGLTESGKAEVREIIENFDINEFKIGLTVTNNLKPVLIKGGTLLQEKPFSIR